MSSQKRNFLIRVLISGKKAAEKLFLHMDSTINVKQTNKKEGDFLILFFVLI